MTDKEIWEKKFKKPELLAKFLVKSGPTISKVKDKQEQQQIKNKDQKIAEEQLKEVTDELDRIKKILKRVYYKKPQIYQELNEHQIKQSRNS